jgi:hypothetical protein
MRTNKKSALLESRFEPLLSPFKLTVRDYIRYKTLSRNIFGPGNMNPIKALFVVLDDSDASHKEYMALSRLVCPLHAHLVRNKALRQLESEFITLFI